MVGTEPGWFDWLSLEPSLVPERWEDVALSTLRVLEMNGRVLYLKGTPDLNEFPLGERRILEALARQGDTVFIAVGQQPGHIRLCYRMPDLENAVAFDAEGLRGLVQQWFVWASTA